MNSRCAPEWVCRAQSRINARTSGNTGGHAAPPSRQLSADCPSTRQWLLRSQVPHATLFLVEGSNGDSNGERRWHVPEAFAGLYAAK